MIEQLAIAICGVTAVLLSQTGSQSTRRWACIFGLAAQPFWFYATWKAQQWGIFSLCFLYSYAWALGLWNNWLKPLRDAVNAEGQS